MNPSLRPVSLSPRTTRVLLVALAALGGAMLLVVAVNRWAEPADEHAYWLAARRLLDGLPLYDPTATAITPYAYWYPPVVAQALAPIALLVPSPVFSAAWIVLLALCAWWLAGRNLLGALALAAFIPVPVEFWFRNVHLPLAVLIVLAIRRWPFLFAVGAAIKLAPGIGLAYLVAARRWHDALIVAVVGAAMLVVSVALSPDAWVQFFEVILARGPADAAGVVPVPFGVRVAFGLVLAVVAGRVRPRVGEPLLVVAIVLSLPTLWVAALATLTALVPLLLVRPAASFIPPASPAPPAPSPVASLHGSGDARR